MLTLAQRSRTLDFIFRIRYPLHVFIFASAFAISWVTERGTRVQRLWLGLPEFAAEHLSISLHTAISGITVLATALALIAALLRTWGAAYLGTGVVGSSALQSQGFAVHGPFAYCRNPLYLGTMLHTLALTLLMSWQGAAFALVAIGVLQLGLVRSEESFLTERIGQPYVRYCEEVARFFPRLVRTGPSVQVETHWKQAFVSEIYMWGAALTFVVFGASYNAMLIAQGLLVSLGLGIIVRGLSEKR